MCDMRGPPKKIKCHDTGEIFDVPYIGSDFNWELNKTPGVYHTSGSGCGYAYFDGQDWHDGYYHPYSHEFNKKRGWPTFEFLDFGPDLLFVHEFKKVL